MTSRPTATCARKEARLRRKPTWMKGLQHTWKRRLLPRLKRRLASTDRGSR
ncbi:hypothetical protein AAGT95_18605 [Salinicola lusitanus]|uniref:Uncharacterized protein n=1 Tax=Salinicola lusitanus TaxID=1949085 RepID=A0ABZ3CRQ5_9GAMM